MPTGGTLTDMMEELRGYWISESAVTGPPNTTHWESLGIVLTAARNGSVIEVARLQDKGVTFDLKELAEWYGLELCRIAVDECLAER